MLFNDGISKPSHLNSERATKSCLPLSRAVADLGGALPARPPTEEIFFNFMGFSENV